MQPEMVGRKISEYPDVMSYRLPPNGRARLKAVLGPDETEAAVVRLQVMKFIAAREVVKKLITTQEAHQIAGKPVVRTGGKL